MADILDYLDWRGDLTMDRDPFNEVDNLILSELSYVDFAGIVPLLGTEGSVPLHQAAEAFFSRYPKGTKIDLGVVLPKELPTLLKKLADCPRFRDARLSCYIDLVDAKEAEQFSALTVETGDGRLYCAYRGTDDTLAGWQEDLELTCVPEVPAQKKAVSYLVKAARHFPRKRIRLGGHSKGGNLAVYAGVFCPVMVQRRLLSVWSNDGPGFHNDILDLPQHQRLADRIHTIVPRSSMVGMLLEHEEAYTVVDSDQLGLWQHDGFSWQVKGPRFVHMDQVGEQAREGSLAVRQWLSTLPTQQRSRFVKALFSVLTASGARTLTDLKEDSLRSVIPMIRAMKELDKETRDGLLDFIQLLLKNNALLVLEGIQDQAERRLSGGLRRED